MLDLFEDWRETWRRKHPGKLPPRLFTVGRLDVNTTGMLLARPVVSIGIFFLTIVCTYLLDFRGV